MERRLTFKHSVPVRLDEDTLMELKTRAAYERKKTGTLIRDILVKEMNRVRGERDPEYQRWRRATGRTDP